MLTLYYSPGACSLAAHIVLEESGAPFEARAVPIRQGAHLTPEYLAINPHARLPALTEGDFTLTENPAILVWLARRFPAAGLLDWEVPERLGRTLELLSFFSSSVHIAFAQIWRAARFAGGAAAREDVVEVGRTAVAGYFDELERLAGDGGWIVHGRYSIADPYLLVFYRWGALIGLDMAAYPGWGRHKQAMLARPAVARALAREGIEIG